MTWETPVGQFVGRVPSRGDGHAASPVRRVRGPGLQNGIGTTVGRARARGPQQAQRPFLNQDEEGPGVSPGLA